MNQVGGRPRGGNKSVISVIMLRTILFPKQCMIGREVAVCHLPYPLSYIMLRTILFPKQCMIGRETVYDWS
jgi:hypothetical protein